MLRLHPMFDTLGIARRLIAAGVEPDQANAIRQAAEHGDRVTTETLDAPLGALEARMYRAMLLQAGAIVGAVVAILRLPG